MYQKLSTKSQGIFWAILACFLVSVMISIIRHLSVNSHPFQIVMMRSFFALVFLLPLIVKNIDQIAKTKNLKIHLTRSVVGLIAMLMWFYVIATISLSEAVAITFIVPIITTLAAILFLKEKVSQRIWISLFVGFIGVLIIIRPGFRDLGLPYLLALITPFIWSISNIITKKMVKTEKPETITLYLSFITFILSIPFAAPYLTPISNIDLLWFALLGLVTNGAYFVSAICYTKVDISIVQPFDFSRLIFTVIIAYFVFDEKADLIMLIGAVIILFGSLLIIPRKSKFTKCRAKVLRRRKLQILPIDN